MSKINKHDFFTDGGHGWLKVPKIRLAKLGIEELVSSYSYMKAGNAYLEEDSDVSLYVEALLLQAGITKSMGFEAYAVYYEEFMYEFWQKTTTHDTSMSGKGKVRGYERYEYRDAKEEANLQHIRMEMMSMISSTDGQALKRVRNGTKSDLLFWAKEYNIKSLS